jgi:hypothetical protein
MFAFTTYPTAHTGQSIRLDTSMVMFKPQTIMTPVKLLSENSLTGVFGCDLDIYLDSGAIQPGFYQAMNQIIAIEIIPTGTVTLRAGNEVLLEEGFEVQAGAILEIEMGECVF